MDTMYVGYVQLSEIMQNKDVENLLETSWLFDEEDPRFLIIKSNPLTYTDKITVGT